MLTILINILFALVLTDFCLKSFELLPAKIFLDTDEMQKLLPRPYLRSRTNSRNFCTLLVFLLLAMGFAPLAHCLPVFTEISSHVFLSEISASVSNLEILSYAPNLEIFKFLHMLRCCLIFLILGHILISDYLFQIVPDEHICILALLGFGTYSFNSLLGFLAGFLPFFVFSILAYLLTGNIALGFGDVKLMGILGLLAGPSSILQVYLLSGIVSGLFCTLLLLLKAFSKIKKGKSYENLPRFVPLAPFIILAFGFISYVSFLQLLPAL